MKKLKKVMIGGFVSLTLCAQTCFAQMTTIEGYGSEFADSNTMSEWSFVNGDLKNYTVEDSYLKLNTAVTGENSAENMVYLNQTMPEVSEYVVRFKPSGSVDGHVAGIFLWQDWNNKVLFNADGKGNDYIVAHCEGYNEYPQLTLDSEGFVYFKLSRNKNSYTFSYSADGVSFTDFYSCEREYAEPKLGLLAQYRGSESDFTALFDYVRVYEEVIEPKIYDEFNGDNLSGWKFINDGLKNYTVSNGTLKFNSYVEGANSSENMLYLDRVIEGDFECIVKYKPNALTADGQIAGLFIYQDWDNKYRFNAEGKGNNYMIINHDNNTTGWPQAETDSDGNLYLKVTRTGNTYTFSYSKDGAVYTDKVTEELNFGAIRMGLFTMYSNYGSYPTSSDDTRNFEAEFEYIRIYQENEPIRFYSGDAEIKELSIGNNVITAKIPYYNVNGRNLLAALAFYAGEDLVKVELKQLKGITEDGVCEITIDINVPEAGEYFLRTFLFDNDTVEALSLSQCLTN